MNYKYFFLLLLIAVTKIQAVTEDKPKTSCPDCPFKVCPRTLANIAGSGKLNQVPVSGVYKLDEDLAPLAPTTGAVKELFDSLLVGSRSHTKDIASDPEANLRLGILPMGSPKKISKILETIFNNRFDTALKYSFKNMHFLGCDSIVVNMAPNLLLRLYIIKPDLHHPSIVSFDHPTFLHHYHQYNFLSQSILGDTVNQRFVDLKKPGNWNSYAFESAVTGVGTLKKTGNTSLRELPKETVPPGSAYFMQPDEMHRVWFQPDKKTGWFVNLFWEFKRQKAPTDVYCKDDLVDIPDKDLLYKRFSEEELRSVLKGTIDALKKVE